MDWGCHVEGCENAQDIVCCIYVPDEKPCLKHIMVCKTHIFRLIEKLEGFVQDRTIAESPPPSAHE